MVTWRYLISLNRVNKIFLPTHVSLTGYLYLHLTIGEFVVNNDLNQPEFDIHNDVEDESSDYPKDINESAQHGDIIDNEWDKKTEYALFRASILKTVLVATADTILPNVCNILRKYLTIEMLKIQEDQIKQALHYHAIKIVESELQRYLTIDLDNPNLFGENLNFIDVTAKSMLNFVEKNKIVEM
ncbi:22043_t:CDS:2 [Gigaspora rosea]|nr:22043_t:CDS:2 [Gigaspora rosea]